MGRDIYTRRESIGAGGYRIRALAVSDDGQHKARWNAEGWFLQASDGDIAHLHASKYQGDAADTLAYFAQEQEGDKGITRMFKYLTVWRPKTLDGMIVGFEATVNAADVFHWLAANRSEMAAALFPDGEPLEFHQC